MIRLMPTQSVTKRAIFLRYIDPSSGKIALPLTDLILSSIFPDVVSVFTCPASNTLLPSMSGPNMSFYSELPVLDS